jgi:hypothetical protein
MVLALCSLRHLGDEVVLGIANAHEGGRGDGVRQDRETGTLPLRRSEPDRLDPPVGCDGSTEHVGWGRSPIASVSPGLAEFSSGGSEQAERLPVGEVEHRGELDVRDEEDNGSAGVGRSQANVSPDLEVLVE